MDVAFAFSIARALISAVEREREECAKLAEERRLWPSSYTIHDAAFAIAETIRRRGE
jgi:hypothetical protein